MFMSPATYCMTYKQRVAFMPGLGLHGRFQCQELPLHKADILAFSLLDWKHTSALCDPMR